MVGPNPLLVGSNKSTPGFGRVERRFGWVKHGFGRVTLVSLTAGEGFETSNRRLTLLLLKLAALLGGTLDTRNGWTSRLLGYVAGGSIHDHRVEAGGLRSLGS